MPTSINVTNLKINELTEAQYDTAVQQGIIGANEISILTDAEVYQVNSTITLTAAGWSNGSQTVNVTGMTATGVVLVSPDPTDQADYTSAGIICSAQAAGTLTFTCDSVPSGDIDVVVVML